MTAFAALDVVMLSRVQFALTIMFHYLFPPLTIGLGTVLVWLGFGYVRTGDPLYRQAQKFWTRIYALNFALGVATGIVMEFQFGTNWAVYSEFVGDVFGSALAAEGVFAFFLESGFLAVLVFGWDRVGPRMHFFSTCMVSLGSMFSAVWIVIANSWQQTPAGHHIVPVYRRGEPWVIDGHPVYRAEIVDFWALVFNPSSMLRLAHVLTGAFIVGGALACSVGAWYLLRGRHQHFAKRSLTGGLAVLTVGAFTALLTGHASAVLVYEHQPAKMAAFEAHWTTGTGNETLVGIPDPEHQRTDYEVAFPGGLSFLLFNNFTDPVVGFDRFRPEDRPPVMLPFACWRIMAGVGTYLIGLTVVACYFRWRGTLFEKRWLLRAFVLTIFPALMANHAGWICAEVGRQPWTVYPPLAWKDGTPGHGDLVVGPGGTVVYDEHVGLRTTNSVSRSVTGGQVLGSIIGFGLVYALLGVVWLWVLNRKIREGPDLPEPAPTGTDDVAGFLDAAAARPEFAGSLTDAKEPVRRAEGGAS